MVSMKTTNQCCVGIDGCKSGWIAISSYPFFFKKAKVNYINDLKDLKLLFPDSSIFLIDIPIGLKNTRKSRLCDLHARKFLGLRKSSIFIPPCKDALLKDSYEEANETNKFKTGKGLSKQAWFLSKKIKEAERQIKSGTQLKEGHPECSFTTLMGSSPRASKKTLKGLFERINALTKLGFNLCDLAYQLSTPVDAAADDLLDAAALCWSASRLATGQGKTIPEIPESYFQQEIAIHI